MSGKSFKGNLEVLNLSDIFQSLAMNRHSGTLVVNDGKREKKIFFAEGEISLLSSGRRMRLGDLLIANGKITEDDLDLALKLQKQSRKKLGEILCEEGFCDEDDINLLLRQQIEEELYDLFLWRKAEFEFMADQMPDDMIRESPNLTRLSINTNSLIMEALRRLDEWSLIQDAVPTTKEVFVVADAGLISEADVPDALKSEYVAIDGKTTVEGLAEKFFSSEFELCQHLATLVKAGGIRPLTQEELVERAEKAYALNDFAGAAALYGRLAEYHPDQAKIMIPLADSLRRTGVEKRALSIYESLAEQLERGGQDPDRLRQCYEAMVQLDPSRHDLVRKIEDLDLRMAAGTSKRGILPFLLVLLLAAGGGAYAYKDKLLGPETPQQQQADVGELVETMKRLEDQGKRHVERGAIEPALQALRQWNGVANTIWRDHADSPEFAKVELPILVSTTPPGFEVFVNGQYQSVTTLDKPTLVCTFRPPADRAVQVDIYDPQAKGSEAPARYSVKYDDIEAVHHVEASIYDLPVPTFIGDGWIDGGVVPVPELDGAVVGVSRTGKLRAFQVDGRNIELVKGLDNAVTLGEFGDVFGPPALRGKTLYVGVTRFEGAGGVVAVDLRAGGDPPAPRAAYKAPGQVAVRPLLVEPAAGVDGGRVVFATLRGDVVAYPLAGAAQPVWSTTVDGSVTQPLLLWPEAVPGASAGLAIAVTDADRVAAVSLSDGALVWTHVLDAAPVGGAIRFGRGLVVPLVDGRVFALTPTGEVAPVPFTEPTGAAVALAAVDDLLVAVDRKGMVHAVRSGEVVWRRELRRSSKTRMPAVVVDGDRVLVVTEVPELVALVVRDGRVAWQGRFSKSGAAGRPIGPLGLAGDTLFVPTDWQKVHVFQRPSGEE